MIRFSPSAALFTGIVSFVLCSASQAQTPHPDTTGWKNLFATDLSNASLPANSWVIENGVLVAKTHDTIWTKESYGNFVLDLEFKVAAESNSGVFLRAGDPKIVLSALGSGPPAQQAALARFDTDLTHAVAAFRVQHGA